MNKQKEQELVKSLDKIYKLSEDNHNIYTPFSLCREMLSSISDYTNKTILVISNLEFLIVLKEKGIDMNNVYYSGSCDIKKSVAIQLGISENKVLDLQYNNKEINLGQKENMKFDVIVANPPYQKGLHLKFLDKCLDIKSDNGEIIFVHPAEWLVQKRKTVRTKFHDVLKSKISGADITFIDNPWDNVALWVPLSITYINNTNQYTYTEKRSFIKTETKPINNLYDICFFGVLKFNSIYNKIYNKAKELSFKDIQNKNLFLNKFITLHRFTGSNIDIIKKTGSKCEIDNKIITIYDRFLLHRIDSHHFNVFDEPQFARTGNERLYMSFNTENEAINCLNFLAKSKIFISYFAYIKIDQHASDTLLSWIPWLDWTQEWTDDKLIEFFELTEDEVKTIDEIIDIITIK